MRLQDCHDIEGSQISVVLGCLFISELAFIALISKFVNATLRLVIDMPTDDAIGSFRRQRLANRFEYAFE